MNKIYLYLFSLLVFLIFPMKAQEGHDFFDPMDVFELEWASDPQVSPDSKTIVYVRKSHDIMKDKVRSNIWQIKIDGKDHRPLYSELGNSYSPHWSPNQERLAFLSNNSGSTQIHMYWFKSGETRAITQLQESPSSLSWSPDGKWIAFTMNVKAKSTSIVKSREKPEGATWAKEPITVTTTQYQYDGRGIVEPSYRHIFVVPAEGGSARQLTTGNFNHYGPLSWSSDSESIFFSAYRSDDWELASNEADIYKVQVNNKKIVQITNQSGEESSPVVSPNGKLVAFSPLSSCDIDTFFDSNGKLLEHIRIEEYVEGTMINLFYDNNIWNISTKSTVGGKNNFYINGSNKQKTFYEMFHECWKGTDVVIDQNK